MKTFTVAELPNGNYFVTIKQDEKFIIERAYEPTDIKGVVSLMLLTFSPHVHSR